jgi:hypothetical protein
MLARKNWPALKARSWAFSPLMFFSADSRGPAPAVIAGAGSIAGRGQLAPSGRLFGARDLLVEVRDFPSGRHRPSSLALSST